MKPLKPYSEACERNREPILDVLREPFATVKTVLEIGSGTGQHAVYFAQALPHLTWQASDAEVAAHHPGIEAWIADSGLNNVKRPLALDVRQSPWPVAATDAVFSANTLHIMDYPSVEAFFRGVSHVLPEGGVLAVYGPFNYGGQFTSASNAQFDALLRARGVGSALRDFEAVDALARGIGLTLLRDAAMPANNRTLVWRREFIPQGIPRGTS
jgi:cyclopropane fatty-acyl-phospholipid synthase-like methyltransferase